MKGDAKVLRKRERESKATSRRKELFNDLEEKEKKISIYFWIKKYFQPRKLGKYLCVRDLESCSITLLIYTCNDVIQSEAFDILLLLLSVYSST